MNRIQFFVLTGLSSLVVLLLIGNVYLVRQVNLQQGLFNQAQQVINQGQASQAMVKQLAVRIFQDSQKSQDQGLKDLLKRQQIKYTPPGTDSTSATEPAAPLTPPSTH